MPENTTFEKNYWDILDLSYYLNVKVKTLYSMIHDIPHYRIGKLIRFKKEEIEVWMENNKVSGLDFKTPLGKKKEPAKSKNNYIDRIIRKAIDQTKQEDYNPNYGKPDHLKGSTKEEVDYGSL